MKAVTAVAEAVAAAPELEFDQLEACVALSCDEHVARLNKTYRGKRAPTNVLSFPASGLRPETNFLGDIVLAGETLAREAEALGVPFNHHLQHLVVHGLLHLLGFDHESDKDAQVMEAIEAGILARLGIPNPYETPASPHQTECAKTP
ncbi:MAG: rRNA maturation RNase YbeY [Hyphomicrobium sp.]